MKKFKLILIFTLIMISVPAVSTSNTDNITVHDMNGDTNETSHQNQFYRSAGIKLFSGDCTEYKVETWLNSIWEMFNDD